MQELFKKIQQGRVGDIFSLQALSHSGIYQNNKTLNNYSTHLPGP